MVDVNFEIGDTFRLRINKHKRKVLVDDDNIEEEVIVSHRKKEHYVRVISIIQKEEMTRITVKPTKMFEESSRDSDLKDTYTFSFFPEEEDY